MSEWITSEADGTVKLRMGDDQAGVAPTTVCDVLKDCVENHGDAIALSVKRDGKCVQWTWSQYQETAMLVAKAFIKLGLEKFHGVGIIGFNSPEWFFADVGGILAGGFAAGIYTTNTPSACEYVLEDCKANICVVEDGKQLAKILEVRERLPHLKAIVQWSGTPPDDVDGVIGWDALIQMGRDANNDEELQSRISYQKPEHCCTLIYTSGTTGNPKGVMVSHDNLTWTAGRICEFAGLTKSNQHIVSYLPLSHVAAQMLDLHAVQAVAGTTWFARPDALKGSLVDTLRDVRPTVFLGVPRVWEKIAEKMQSVGRSTHGLKKRIAEWAKGVGLNGNHSLERGGSLPWGWWIANKLVFSNVKKSLGLDRCPFLLTGAAPISRELEDYFASLDLVLNSIYGMSESTGPQTVSLPDQYRSGSVGRAFPGAEMRIDSPNADGNGEICFRGRHIMMGYLGKEEKTIETVDKDGWLHSGDVGRVDDDGFLFITGRIKELLITAGGENIAPVLIEDILKEEAPIISNCMLIGDQKKFLSILVTLKCDVDQENDNEPLDQLSPFALLEAKKAQSSAKTVSEAIKDPKINEYLQAAVTRANARAISRAQNIQKFTILPKDFSINGGELGPTLKLKRPVVLGKFKAEIDAFYA